MLVDAHVIPNARANEVVGMQDGRLRVRVRAPAVDGKANDALRALLAKHFGVRRSAVSIVRGERARHKTVRIDGVHEPSS